MVKISFVVMEQRTVIQMTIDTSGANNAISEAIKAVCDDAYIYEDLRMSTIKLISATSYLVGCLEGMQGESDDNTGSD